MMGFEAVEALGITVVPVTTLKNNAALVSGQDVLLVRDDLDSVERDVIVEWALGKVAPERRVDYARFRSTLDFYMQRLDRLRRKGGPVFHHTAAGLISTMPDTTLPPGAQEGPGNAHPSLCGLTLRDVWLRGDNPIVLDLLGSVRVCKRCATAREAGR